MATLTINTRTFRASHMREPRGRGGWLFAPAGSEDDPDAHVCHTGTYTEARAALRRSGATGTWSVLP